MRYIIMAGRGGTAEVPRQLWKVCGEHIILRTIRLLRECGVTDIAISTQNDMFKQIGLPILRHNNCGPWINGFYPTDEPTCYIFGDVVFSKEAIQTIVETETDSIEFFASAPPFSAEYPKQWAEPFAFKVVDTEYFKQCVDIVRENIGKRVWRRGPIAWELWQIIKHTPVNHIDYTNYTVINDFTCDVDELADLKYYENIESLEAKNVGKVQYMIHAVPKRMWYVSEYLIPSMLEQGIQREQIDVYCDDKQLGNLKACMDAFLQTGDNSEGTWHLQDDVIISSKFAEQTARYNRGLVAGFCSTMYDKDRQAGNTDVKNMWYSFPCIRIPNKIAKDCAKWVLEQIIGNPVYTKYWKDGRNDDWSFKLYLGTCCKRERAYNLAPNLVEHIDYLIGGSANGSSRAEHCTSAYWNEEKLVEELRKKLWRGSQQTKENT